MSDLCTRLPDDAKHVLIAMNPKAGAKDAEPVVRNLEKLLRQRDYDVAVITDVDEISGQSSEYLKQGSLRAVIAAGGDGTAGLIANRTDLGTPITVFPMGTENLLSKYIGVRADAESVCEMIDEGNLVKLDAGRVADQLFLLMVSCGFDAEVVRRLHEAREGHIRHMSYAKPILDSIRNYQYPELRVYCDDEDAITARWGFVFNLPCYAMGLPIAPDAVATDGLLDVCTFKEGSLWNGLMYLGGVVFGQHRAWQDCVAKKTRRIRIESDEEVPFEIDGDPGGYLPVDIEILPQRLTLVVPKVWAEKQSSETAERMS